MSEHSTSDMEQPFEEWLTDKLEEYRAVYHDGQRTSENAREKDIALGRLRAFRDARTEYLNRSVGTDIERGDHQ